MSSLQVRLNGTPIRGRIEGLESFSVTYSRDEQTGATQKAYTNELKFFDDGFDLIFNTLVASQQGLYKYIKVQIWDECCNEFIYQDFIIKGDSVDYCTGDCFVVARMTREDADERIYDCFKRTPITTDLENPDGSVNNSHWTLDVTKGITIPMIPYCNDSKPAVFHHLLIVIVQIVTVIISLLSGLFSVIFGQNNAITNFNKWIGENLISCGRKHPSPRIVDYIGEGAKYCNCNQATPFVSGIFTHPNSWYASTLYFYAPLKPGDRKYKNNSSQRYIVENRPRQTITEFLNQIASDFNANWWVENGVLYMERKDYYLGAPIIFDAIAEAKRGNILNGPCFKYNQGTLYSAQRIKAQMDLSEGCGNHSIDLYSVYFDYVKWYNNPAGWESWRDVKDVQLNFAPVRFSDELWPRSGVSSYPFLGLLNAQYGNVISSTRWMPLLQKEEFAVPKYYEWDQDLNTVDEARPRTAPIQQYVKENQTLYPTNVIQSNPRFCISYVGNLQSGTSNIYKDFHAINDPTQNPYRFWDYEIEAKMDCVMVKNLSVNRTVRMQTPYGTSVQGKINTIIANFGERTIRITGEF